MIFCTINMSILWFFQMVLPRNISKRRWKAPGPTWQPNWNIPRTTQWNYQWWVFLPFSSLLILSFFYEWKIQTRLEGIKNSLDSRWFKGKVSQRRVWFSFFTVLGHLHTAFFDSMTFPHCFRLVRHVNFILLTAQFFASRGQNQIRCDCWFITFSRPLFWTKWLGIKLLIWHLYYGISEDGDKYLNLHR